MAQNKARVIKSLEKLTEDLQELVQKQYPYGYEESITRITNAKKEPIFVFPLETEDSIILVKVPVTKNSDGEYSVEPKEEEFEESDVESESSSYESEDDGYDKAEASYDPDFDD